MTQLIKYCLLAFIPLVISCSTSGQKETTDDYLNGLIKDKKIAGMAVAVLKGNDIILAKNSGFADVDKQEIVTDSTQFGIMSITKNFIAYAVMQLSEKKQIDLNSSIRKYLDKLPPAYDKVLVHQLLNHTAGVPDYVEVHGYLAQANKTQTPWEVLTTILDKPLAFNPGEKSAYSNSGYFLLGLLIEKVSGRSLGEYLTENIFTPVGMGHTFFDDGSIASSSARAKGYEVVNNQLKEVAPLNPSQYWAAGAIVTTLADMIKWNQAVKKGTILPASVINQMMQPAKLSDGTNSEYGLGFELMNASDMKMAGNNGAGIGFNAANLQFINDGLTVIVLTNTSNSNSTLIAKNIRDLVVGGRSEDAIATTPKTKDKLDSAIMQVFMDAGKGNVNAAYFMDADAVDRFKEGLDFIQSQGGFKGLDPLGERIDPESIARKYQVHFEKGDIRWVFIFSLDKKITIVNHQ